MSVAITDSDDLVLARHQIGISRIIEHVKLLISMRHDLLRTGCHRGRAILPGQRDLLLSAVEVEARLQLGHLIGYTIVACVLLKIGVVTHLLI